LQEILGGRSNHSDVEIFASPLILKTEVQTMKRFLIALALTCVLSGSVLAGDVDTAGAPAPAPGETQGGNAPGDMGNGGTAVLLAIFDLVF
jgi:hypothetical protein